MDSPHYHDLPLYKWDAQFRVRDLYKSLWRANSNIFDLAGIALCDMYERDCKGPLHRQMTSHPLIPRFPKVEHERVRPEPKSHRAPTYAVAPSLSKALTQDLVLPIIMPRDLEVHLRSNPETSEIFNNLVPPEAQSSVRDMCQQWKSA